ncbi:MAG: hypothetical protein ACJA2S_004146 [Cyclobacteriaceae bacterium]|jgi:hypothetical protein
MKNIIYVLILLLFTSCKKEFCEESKVRKDKRAFDALSILSKEADLHPVLKNYKKMLEMEYWASNNTDTFQLIDKNKMRFQDVDSLKSTCLLTLQGATYLDSEKYLDELEGLGILEHFIPVVEFNNSGEIIGLYTLVKNENGEEILFDKDNLFLDNLINLSKVNKLITTKSKRVRENRNAIKEARKENQKQLKINAAQKEKEEKLEEIRKEKEQKEKFKERIHNAREADNLLRDFYENEVKQNNEFKNQTFDIKGTVYRIVDDKGGLAKIILNGNGYGYIICFVEESRVLDQLGTGDFVVLEGKCVGFMDDAKTSLYFMEANIVAL